MDSSQNSTGNLSQIERQRAEMAETIRRWSDRPDVVDLMLSHARLVDRMMRERDVVAVSVAVDVCRQPDPLLRLRILGHALFTKRLIPIAGCSTPGGEAAFSSFRSGWKRAAAAAVRAAWPERVDDLDASPRTSPKRVAIRKNSSLSA